VKTSIINTIESEFLTPKQVEKSDENPRILEEGLMAYGLSLNRRIQARVLTFYVQTLLAY
jgi:hypothetical protein